MSGPPTTGKAARGAKRSPVRRHNLTSNTSPVLAKEPGLLRFARRVRLAAAVLLIGLLCGCGESDAEPSDSGMQNPTPRVSGETDGGREITLPPYIYDAAEPDPFPYTLHVVNRTAAPVQFKGIRTSCGCTDATMGKPSLDSDEAMEVAVRLEVRGFEGIRVVHVDLIPDGGAKWRYTLRLPAYPKAQFERREIFLGRLPYGEASTHEIELITHAAVRAALPRLAKLTSKQREINV